MAILEYILHAQVLRKVSGPDRNCTRHPHVDSFDYYMGLIADEDWVRRLNLRVIVYVSKMLN